MVQIVDSSALEKIEEGKVEDGDNGKAPQKKNRKEKVDKKLAALLALKTEQFADDSALYKARLRPVDRRIYWTELLKNKTKKLPPLGFKSWIQRELSKDIGLKAYPLRLAVGFKFVRHVRWDHYYINCFLLWLLLLIAVYDGYVATYAPAFILEFVYPGSVFLLAPLLLMIIFQLIPIFGVVYYTVFCNDLVKYLAGSELGKWAFCAVIVSQFVERFCYGGIGLSERAGTCKIDPTKSIFGSIMGAFSRTVVFEEPPEPSLEERMKSYGFDVVEKGEVPEDVADVEAGNKRNDDETLDDATVNTHSSNGTKEPNFDEMGVLAKLKYQKMVEEKERKKLDAEQKARDDLLVTDWREWTCVTCSTENKQPAAPKLDYDVFFGITGEFHKRTYAKITPRRQVPRCVKCSTFADYKPPLSSAHTFKNYSKPNLAFENYPTYAPIQSGLKNTFFAKLCARLRSCFYGVSDNPDSRQFFNDWRLRVYLRGIFHELPRQVKPADELYQVGEIIECKLQKSEWCRAKVIVANYNHTYDIKYDPGDELRLVHEQHLRLPPEKRTFAYWAEISMVFLVIFFPIGLLAAYAVAPGLVFVGPLLVSLFLLSLRIAGAVKNCRKHSNAGCCIVFRLFLLFSVPLILLLLASALAYIKDGLGMGWGPVAYLFSTALWSTVPVLYILRPPYVVFLSAVYFQITAALVLIAFYLDGTPVTSYIAVALGPAITSTCTLKWIRYKLHHIWDPCLTVRPPHNYIVNKFTLWERLKDLFSKS